MLLKRDEVMSLTMATSIRPIHIRATDYMATKICVRTGAMHSGAVCVSLPLCFYIPIDDQPK